MKYFLTLMAALLMLAASTLLLFSCAQQTSQRDQEGGIVGSGNAIDCRQHPDDEKCRKKLP